MVMHEQVPISFNPETYILTGVMSPLIAESPLIHFDGRACDHPSNDDDYFYSSEQAEREDSRLSSFRRVPSSFKAVPRRLAAAGFYYTGHRDVVRCFSCGRCVEDMRAEDDPRDGSYHHPNCEHRNENDRRNIPSSTPSMIGFQSLLSTLRQTSREPRVRNRSSSEVEHQTSNEVINPTQQQISPAPVVPSPRPGPPAQEPTPSRAPQQPAQPPPPSQNLEVFRCRNPNHPEMRDFQSRLSTFTGWDRRRVIASPRDIAEAGFFYLGDGDRVKCWYCNGGLENFERDDDIWIEHAKWFPHCEFLLKSKGREFVNDISSAFPNLQRPTVSNPPPQVPPSQQQMGPGSSVQQSITTPGRGRARGRGTTIHVARPGRIFININSNMPVGTPTITTTTGPSYFHVYGRGRGRGFTLGSTGPPQFLDPQSTDHEQTVQQAMENSELVLHAREMGFSDEIIKMVLLSKCMENNGQLYQNFPEMADALLEYQNELQRTGQTTLHNTPSTSTSGSSTTESQDQTSNPAENQIRQLEERRNCRICHRETANMVLMPCAHLAVCNNCSRDVRICPVCKQIVRNKIRSFLS